MAHPGTDIVSQVKARLAHGQLTKWEDEFLNSLIRQVANGKALSDKQARKLSEIIDKTPSTPVITRFPRKS